jgi:hypothetical protein
LWTGKRRQEVLRMPAERKRKRIERGMEKGKEISNREKSNEGEVERKGIE